MGPEQNIVYAKRFTDFLIGKFPAGTIEPERVLIHFQDLMPHEVGIGGTTVEMLLANADGMNKAK